MTNGNATAALETELIRAYEGVEFAAKMVGLAAANGMPLPYGCDAAMVLHEWALDGDGLWDLSAQVAHECAVWLTCNKRDTYRLGEDGSEWVLTRTSLVSS